MVNKNVNHNHKSVTGCEIPSSHLHSYRQCPETIFTLSLFLLPLLYLFNNILLPCSPKLSLLYLSYLLCLCNALYGCRVSMEGSQFQISNNVGTIK